MSASHIDRRAEVVRLRAERPRSLTVRFSLVFFCALAVFAWVSGEIDAVDFLSKRRRANVERFLEQDVLPYPLRESVRTEGGGGTLELLWSWVAELWTDRGADAFWTTLWISTLAIVLAGVSAVILSAPAARTLMRTEPFARTPARGAGEWPWRICAEAVRFSLVGLRAIPEFVWAFLFLALFGPGAWPAILALAIHNAGILGRLNADTVENLDGGPLRALRSLGASRRQVFGLAILPLALSRFLLYFFYRFETCVREATVLGMLGIVSLGYWIQDARARQRYDEMVLFVVLGALLVLVADVLSQLARAALRRAR